MRATIMSACVGWLCLLVSAGALSAASPLILKESSFDFGYAPQNSKVTHTFVLRNSGPDSLTISRVVPGCGCTKAPLEKSELGPGESTELEIIFSTGRYNRRITKKPRIEVEGEATPHFVTIVTDVVSRPDATYPMVIRPYKLDLSQFENKVRDQLTFSLTNVSDHDVAVTVIDYPAELIQLDMPEQVRSGSSARATVTLHSAATAMSFERSITIQLDDNSQSRFSIPIKRTVRSPDPPVAGSVAKTD